MFRFARRRALFLKEDAFVTAVRNMFSCARLEVALLRALLSRVVDESDILYLAS
jgi:hypothetical protein